jgi:hypothetical protein
MTCTIRIYLYIYNRSFSFLHHPIFQISFYWRKIQISAKRFGFFGSKTKPKDCVPLLLTPALLLLVFPGHETGDAKLMFLQANSEKLGRSHKLGTTPKTDAQKD